MSTLERGPAPASTLRRPGAKEIASFRVSMVGQDTVRTFLTKGYSLAIFCKACDRTVEWTPPVLLQRSYGDRISIA